MQIKITKKEEEPLLSRKEISAEMVYDAVTPSRAETKKALANELKVSEGAIVIKCIHPIFGEKKARLTAEVYDNVEVAKKIALKVYVKRDSGDKKRTPKEEKPKSEKGSKDGKETKKE